MARQIKSIIRVSTSARWLSLAVILAVFVASAVRADMFTSAYYDDAANQLVVTIMYDGSNPDHQFTLQWGTCQMLGTGGGHQIDAEVLDSQWNDTGQRTFTKTVRFSLAGLQCRPATVTLRTAPHFLYTVQIP